MKCNEIRELLSLYIDSMLEESQIKVVEEHLSACDACRNEYNEMKEMVMLLGQAETVSIPDDFSFRLRKALNEEKQNMIASGAISKTPKKNQWRIITSIAAVFAVGVISLSLYHDVLGILPDKLGGTEQAAEAPQAGEIYGTTDEMENPEDDSIEESNISSDGSVVMKDQDSELQPLAKAKVDVSEVEKSGDLYGYSADSSDADAGESAGAGAGAGLQDIVTGQEDASAGADGSDEALEENTERDITESKMFAATHEEFSRSLTVSGIERNAAAVQYYDNLIEEKLSGFDYQILESSYAQTGEWRFRIFIFRGKDGNTYNEEILVIGKDGKIEAICSNEFMGL